MNVLIVLAHPDKNSFNHAIAETCRDRLIKNGHSVNYYDLYLDNFDPVIKKEEFLKGGQINAIVKKQCDDLINCDGIIVVHPNWWGQPPAILKGWIDRVIRPGLAYEFVEGDNGEGIPVGLLKAETALVFNTANTSKHREDNNFGDPLETIWRNCIFDFCGVKKFHRRIFRIMVTSTLEQRKVWLDEVKMMMDTNFAKK